MSRRELDGEGISFSLGMTTDGIEGWESMNHVFRSVEIEKPFAGTFQAAEMGELRDVGELMGLQGKKRATRG